MLTLPAGGSATFFCNISMENDSSSEYSLNWYKETNHSQAQKIAEINPQISQINRQMKTEKYLLTNHTPAFKIEILNLHQNDSGSYFCGLITFFEPDKVMESNRSQLVVTGQPGQPAWDQALSEDTNAIPGLCVFLLCIALRVCAGDGRYLRMMNHLNGISLQKEEKPPVVSVSTVDYGVLEFQWDQHIQVPPETSPVDQTEYATIIFSEEKPVTPERGKKHLDEKMW
uniref:Programmed cell death 1 n=1 Tax=Strigops habroptila TaxID=2489341 RepID=A0A672UGZ8_STRHB